LAGDTSAGAAGAAGPDPARREFTSALTVAVGTPLILLGEDVLTIAAWTVAGVAVGYCCRYKAAQPATWGDAMDVPESTAAAVFEVFHAEVILTPGASTSTTLPKFEKDAQPSLFDVAPTVIACATRAGE
jgi:hypothetical protein